MTPKRWAVGAAVALTLASILAAAGLWTKHRVEDAWKNGLGKENPGCRMRWEWRPWRGQVLPQAGAGASYDPPDTPPAWHWSWSSWSWEEEKAYLSLPRGQAR